MRAFFTALAMCASFNALGQQNEALEVGLQQRAALTLAARVQAGRCRDIPESASGGLRNSQIEKMATIAPLSSVGAMAFNGLAVCMDGRLEGTHLEDGREVVASIELAAGLVRLNPQAKTEQIMDMAGKGVAEALLQIRLHGGNRVPAHMLQALAVVLESDSTGGFTIIPNDRNVLRTLRPAAGP